MYETLLRLTSSGKIEPMLATSWEMSADAKTWTIHLRRGVQWQENWGEFTARDVAHSLDRMTAEDALSSQVGTWRAQLEVPKKPLGERVEVADPHRVILRLANPAPGLDQLLSSAWDLQILSKAQFDAQGVAGLAKRPAPGTGPYGFVERQLGAYVLYKRIEGKHWRVTPDFEELQIFLAPEESTRIAMLLTGEVDITQVSPDLEKQAESRGMKVIPSTLPSTGVMVVLAGNYLPTGPQYDASAPWTKKKVREAMNRAINRDELNKALVAGRGELQMLSWFDASLPGWNPEWPEKFKEMYGYNPARARELLAEAGYAKGFKVKLWSVARSNLPQMNSVAEAIAGYWKAIGLDVEVAPTDYAPIRAKSREATLNDPWSYTTPYFLNPEDGLRASFHSKGPAVRFFNSKEGIDEPIEKLLASSDPKERERLLREIGGFLFNEYTHVPLFWLKATFTVNPKVVAEYATHGVPIPPVQLEYIKAVR
jgi:ABC-type transport system substrate-binding protein